MFKGFQRDLVSLVAPSFKSAAIGGHHGAPIDIYHAVNDCARNIGGWKDWTQYGIFAVQNPLSRYGDALVAMASLSKDSEFKSVQELVKKYGFDFDFKHALEHSTKIEKKRDSFYGGYHMPNESVDFLGTKIQEIYSDKVSMDRDGTRNAHNVVAVTFSPESNYQVASFWHKEFPIVWTN